MNQQRKASKGNRKVQFNKVEVQTLHESRKHSKNEKQSGTSTVTNREKLQLTNTTKLQKKTNKKDETKLSPGHKTSEIQVGLTN